MKKKLWLLLIVVLLAAIVCGAVIWFVSKNKEDNPSLSEESNTSSETQQAGDFRDTVYTGEWIDKSVAEQSDSLGGITDVRINTVYKDCFFAVSVIPLGYAIKFNGALPEEWCVGDQVVVDCTNIYIQEDANRMEADMQGISASDYETNNLVCYKPVIYLYPETETEISVRLDINGKLTCTYPAYNGGWCVTASPDGTLRDAEGQTYNYLYWEGNTSCTWDLSGGFCVKGEDTAAFLEDALAKLGLNRREANEFIIYWLPQMEQNAYNIISFQTDTYTEAAKLSVSPAPDTVIRVFMTWKASAEPVEIVPLELTAPERKGFTVVEWGGTEIK